MSLHTSAYGRLGRDPKIITTSSGKPMTAASIACDLSSQRDPDATHWLPLLAFGAQAETLAKHQQGDMIAVTGRMQRKAWTDKDGAQRIDLQLVVDGITSSRSVRPGGRPKRRKEVRAARDDYAELARGNDDFNDAIGL
ncbi:MAG: single-stranded DNA-binding protein [Gammaproteobacteria bacterium]|mgnify:FL=1|jgi:single-strand DNA-binding protein|nr:single-stranded DNA-binding protein [Gammaproteobacteria bacterium]MBK8990895.1 single-stranded DNA-binding protein [Gammaproteobacteria bacterium]MBK9466554.1 single-stranded DNA-binding protein [Gammaproteobacteria bacterium]MBP7909181.1 single-stranded DNA-binding protein [Pseudomonadales bacterium]